MERIVKVYNASDITVDEGKREVVSIINTEAVDRSGEVVQPRGMKRKNYQGNPVVFANHSYMFDPKALPIGTCRWIKASVDKAGNDILIAKTYISDKTQEARDVFSLLQDGVMNAFSIGFNEIRGSKPSTAEINARPELKGCSKIIREWELLEYSVVGIPCNQEALALAVSKGYSQKTIDILSGKEEATIKAAEEVIEAAQQVEAVQEKKISKKELADLLAKHIEKATQAINADAMVERVIKGLFK